jgi:signal transduction histidine kinase
VRPSAPDPVFERNRISEILLEDADGTLIEPRRQGSVMFGQQREATFVAKLQIKAPEAGLVIFVPELAARANLAINGAAVPEGDAPTWRPSLLGAKWTVPPALLQKGENTLTLRVSRDHSVAYIGWLIAGPPAELDTPIRTRRMQAVIPSFGMMVVGLVAALACAMAARNCAYRSVGLAAGLAFTGVALSGLWQIDILTPSSAYVNAGAGQLILLAIFVGLVALADRWFPGGPRYDRVLMAASVIYAALIVGVTFRVIDWTDLFDVLLEGSIVVFANVAICAAVWRALARDRRVWAPDAAVFLLVPGISLIDLIDSILRPPLTHNFAPLGVLGLTILLMLGIVRRGQALSQRLEDANALLDARIAEKEAELEATAQRLRAAEAEAAVQRERSRIMRDMHDGMGGQLLAVLMLSRDEAAPRTAITKTVEHAIDDLRLLIDSLDSVGDSLDFALGQFRERAETKLRAAGMQLGWSNRLESGTIALPPGTVLTIYRIMQEAINNAVRHSGGSRVSIAIAPVPAGGAAIVIADDGKPDPAQWRKGRGLANLERRANEIGGTFVLETGAAGTSITITFPAA